MWSFSWTMISLSLSLFLISVVSAAPKKTTHEDATSPVKVAYSVKSSSTRKGATMRLHGLPESTLPHAPVLREMLSEAEQHDMSTSTPSSESLESQLQSPHVIRKKAFVDDFDTSSAATGDDLMQTLELVQ